MRDKLRKLEAFEQYDYDGIARRCETMARQGWLLESVGRTVWTYRRTEPRELKFFAAYLPRSSGFDPEPTDEEWEFREFCRRTGWRLAASQGQLQIFYNESPDPVPIETDPAIELETIRAAARRSFLPSWYALLAVALMNVALHVYRIVIDPIGVFISSVNLLTMALFSLMVLLCAGELVSFYMWVRRAKRAAAVGERAGSMGRMRFSLVCLVALFLIMAAWLVLDVRSGGRAGSGGAMIIYSIVYALVLIAAVNGTVVLMKRARASRRVNMAVTAAVAFVMSLTLMVVGVLVVIAAMPGGFAQADDPTSADTEAVPLELTDIFGEDTDVTGSRVDAESSPLMTSLTFSQDGVDGDWDFMSLRYTVYKFRAPLVGGLCLNELLNRYADRPDREVYAPSDPAPWGVDRAWYLDSVNQYVLEKDGDIAQLYAVNTTGELSPAQKAVIGGRLFR